VLELREAGAAVVTCVASAEAIDVVVEAVGGVRACRIAPDEAMLLSGDAKTVLAAAHRCAADVDVDAVVLDASDGWRGWALEGDTTREGFARLSALELPDEGFAQGEVAGVAVRVVAEPRRVVLLVPAMCSEHVRSRILSRCADLHVREVGSAR
jgi:hypothetical protein